MNITFRPAIRTKQPLLIGLAGPSRSGKTRSALRLAAGLAQGGTVAMIDTESGRGGWYADQHKYLRGDLDAPFTSERYLEAIKAAKATGAKVIIVDSASHEHEGVGGMLEQHENELERMAGKDWKKRERMTFTAWIRPKAAHNTYVNELLRMGADTHFVFCFRAKEKLLLRKGEEPVNLGWTPIASSRFEYEMSCMLVLPEGSQGRVDLTAASSGLRDPFQQFISDGQQIDEALGEKLAKWAAGVGERNDSDLAPLIEQYRAAGVELNRDHFDALEVHRRKMWPTLSARDKALLKAEVDIALARVTAPRVETADCACPDGPAGIHVKDCSLNREPGSEA